MQYMCFKGQGESALAYDEIDNKYYFVDLLYRIYDFLEEKEFMILRELYYRVENVTPVAKEIDTIISNTKKRDLNCRKKTHYIFHQFNHKSIEGALTKEERNTFNQLLAKIHQYEKSKSVF